MFHRIYFSKLHLLFVYNHLFVHNYMISSNFSKENNFHANKYGFKYSYPTPIVYTQFYGFE